MLVDRMDFLIGTVRRSYYLVLALHGLQIDLQFMSERNCSLCKRKNRFNHLSLKRRLMYNCVGTQQGNLKTV